MDENNLDNMLAELGGDFGGDIDDNLEIDGGIDIDLSDLPDISLSEMDDLDHVDLSDLDLDDIDFDDVDITNLSTDTAVPKAEEPDEEISLESIIAEAESAEADVLVDEHTDDVFEEAKAQEEMDLDVPPVYEDPDIPPAPLTDIPDREPKPVPAEEPAEEAPSEASAAEQPEAPAEADASPTDDLDIDDLLDSLDIGEAGGEDYTKGADDLDAMLAAGAEQSLADPTLDGIEDIGEKTKKKRQKKDKSEKEKKSIKEILFGAPDEDDIEEEAYLEERKAKKAEEKEAKKAEKEVKKQEKQEKLEAKKREGEKAKAEKSEKKAQKQAALEAELEEEKGQKQVPTPVVLIVFLIFAALGVMVVLGTKAFNYSQVIRKATDYFDRQKYHMAYDEVSGIEVKEKDEELRDRIYTVMYVERLYESYENNMMLGRRDKALDALLRGIEKYDEHYEEAVELGIEQDIVGVRAKITAALWTEFDITEDEARVLMALEGFEYAETLKQYAGGGGTPEE